MSDIKQEAVRGVRWTSLNSVGTTVLQFVQLAILGRILGPEAYGLMAMIMVVIGFADIFAGMELSTAIIQRKNPSRNQLSSLYWINVAAGFIVYLIIYLAAPWITAGFGVPDLKPLLRVASLSFVIGPFGAQFQTLLLKALCFDVITKISISSALISTGVAIYCATIGLGVWSLVWGGLVKTIMRTGLYIFMGWRMGNLPGLHFHWGDTNGYISFGLYRVGAMAANQFNSRVDQLVIGTLLGPVTLGYYNIAFRLVLQPIQKVNPILTQVAFPVFSIVQDDTARLKRGFLKMLRLIMSINAPLLIGLSAVAPLAVPLLMGEKWLPSVPIVQVLAFYALLRSLGNASGSLIVAKGKASWTFYWNLALLLLIPITVYTAATVGGTVIHVAFALVGLNVILHWCFRYPLIIRKLLGPIFREYFFTIVRPILTAAVMGLVVLVVSSVLPEMALSIRLFMQVTAGAISYLILSWLLQRDLFAEVLEIVPMRVKRLINPINRLR